MCASYVCYLKEPSEGAKTVVGRYLPNGQEPLKHLDDSCRKVATLGPRVVNREQTSGCSGWLYNSVV